ncbi:hypothetical protein F2P81_020111 [Scophthalmus maximus]|uniref:Uncharacterized protein n=1 Tax=Scophthalmus maximus TaxID=52904 RepID=A0A6A4S745_SCOMX|nr:hypothetical protein F2P81_020111 [Scophthalmus maximus]
MRKCCKEAKTTSRREMKEMHLTMLVDPSAALHIPAEKFSICGCNLRELRKEEVEEERFENGQLGLPGGSRGQLPLHFLKTVFSFALLHRYTLRNIYMRKRFP